jgi:hypothetical protein
LKRKLIFSLILLIPLILLGLRLWDQREKDAPSQTSADVEELQALPYATWTKNNENSSRRGVTKFDSQRAWHGYNLFTDDVNTAFLMDMSGRKLHSWRFQKNKKCEYTQLLPNGDILGVCMGQGVWKVDWNSNVIWRTRYFVHHDIQPLPDGTFWTTRREKNREYKGRFVVFDALQRLSADGQLLDRWYTYDHLEELRRWHEPSSLDVQATNRSPKKYDYYHLNSVKLLPENPLGKSDQRFQKGNLLICLRNVNLIAILDKETMRVVWGYGPEQLDWPHMPVMLPTGNILIFDNGIHRKYSRVLEINPLSKEIVWSYGAPGQGFFSALRGSAQRLSNGNTLICESDKGHVFEVDLAGSIVWEFWNPDMKESSRRAIYRMLRFSAESLPAELIARLPRVK